MGARRFSIETSTPARALLKAHLTEKAWEAHQEYDIQPAMLGKLSGAFEKTTTITTAANQVKVARARANMVTQAADLADWERRLKEREQRLGECEDAIENMATVHSRRSSVVLRAMRLDWGRRTAVWSHHIAGLALVSLILGAILAIGAHWEVKHWQCSQWQISRPLLSLKNQLTFLNGIFSWACLGFAIIAGLSYLARIWIEERAIDCEESGAYIFACLMPFTHILTCLLAALWSVGISSVCHAV